MKITRAEAILISMVLQQQARKHRDLLGPSSILAPSLEKIAAALKKGEALEIGERK